MNDRLWSMDDIAEYLSVNKHLVRRKLICKTTFPKPIVLPTGGPRGAHRRWISTEVKKWVLRHKD